MIQGNLTKAGFGASLVIMSIGVLVGFSSLRMGVLNFELELVAESILWILIGSMLFLIVGDNIKKLNSIKILKTIFVTAIVMSTFMIADNIIQITTADWNFIDIIENSYVATGEFYGYSLFDGLYDYFIYGNFKDIGFLDPHYGITSITSIEFDGMVNGWYLQVIVFGLLDALLFLGFRETKRFLANPNHKRLKFQNPLKIIKGNDVI